MPLESFAVAEPQPSVLGVLRARTRALHDQVESGVDLGRALASREGYRQMLEGYLSLYRTFEVALTGAPAAVRELAMYPQRARVPLLEGDLRALGVSEAEVAAVPAATELPDLAKPDAILGALYVIEGSQLGGQVIYREIQDKLQLDQQHGAAFFFGDGENTSRQWKRFLAGLEEQVYDPDAAADAAAGMFRYFEIGLSKK